MSVHPIIFSTDMVIKILTCANCGTITIEIKCPKCGSKDRLKTQTRRIIKPQPEWMKKQPNNLEAAGWKWKTKKVGLSAWAEIDKFLCELTQYCPYGQVGDRLWVKEGYQIEQYTFRRNCVGGKYLADNKEFWTEVYQREYDLIKNRKFPLRATSGRFMYKSLARIFLEITNIRVERVQDINVDDCFAEGVSTQQATHAQPYFTAIWNSINAKRGYGWDKNPWVWVIEFKRD